MDDYTQLQPFPSSQGHKVETRKAVTVSLSNDMKGMES